ncbi:hypothetical protein KVT40_004788 [Elsinoe batatas]|uniref:Metallo-beta-lactamase domain-containing protein n=1 Tax=Elsinoe batatas TaxID=2601811 RepID=A0A8K0L1Q7_9PEZI|nr:hypothetical protein KVT40_004788 [Elsinoe batatas]
MEPVIRSIFEPVTGTWQHLITDSSTKATAVVDPVLNYDPVKNEISTTTAEHLLETIRENDLTVEWMLEAHAHADHLTAAAYLQDQFIVDQGINVPICIGRGISVVQQRWAERYSIPSHEVENAFDRTFVDGETFNIGSIKVEVMHLPGHTPDHVGYMVGSNVLTGDSIFNPDVGSARTDFPGGSASQLWKSMTRLLNLPDDFRLYTGHDYPPADRTANDDGPRERPYSTVKEQRAANKHVKSGTKEEDFRCFARSAAPYSSGIAVEHPGWETTAAI